MEIIVCRRLPQIKFVKESEMGDGPFMIGDIEVTDELLEKVEAYIQEEIEMMHKPTSITLKKFISKM